MLFRIHWTTTASTTTEVEADDFDSALEASYELLPGSLCHQCAREYDVIDAWEEYAAYVDDSDVDLLADARGEG